MIGHLTLSCHLSRGNLIIFILLHNLFYKLGFIYGDYSLIDVAQKVGASFYMGDPELLLGTFWFLQQLIRVSIIAWIILKACKYLSIYLEFHIEYSFFL